MYILGSYTTTTTTSLFSNGSSVKEDRQKIYRQTDGQGDFYLPPHNFVWMGYN